MTESKLKPQSLDTNSVVYTAVGTTDQTLGTGVVDVNEMTVSVDVRTGSVVVMIYTLGFQSLITAHGIRIEPYYDGGRMFASGIHQFTPAVAGNSETISGMAFKVAPSAGTKVVKLRGYSASANGIDMNASSNPGNESRQMTVIVIG